MQILNSILQSIDGEMASGISQVFKIDPLLGILIVLYFLGNRDIKKRAVDEELSLEERRANVSVLHEIRLSLSSLTQGQNRIETRQEHHGQQLSRLLEHGRAVSLGDK